MANWSNPQLTSTYTNTLTEIKNRDVDLALQFDGTTSTNLTTGTIRWSSSANRWQKWSGTAWGELTGTYALTGLSTTGAATIGTTLSVTGAATLSGGGTSTTAAVDNNSTSIATTAFVIGQAAGTAPLINGTAAVGTSHRYARQDHVHPTDTTRAPLASPVFTGSVTIPSGASIAGYAPLANPTFTGVPAAPTATTGTSTTQIASTAFVANAVAAISTTPAGAINFFAMSAAPAGYLKANGAEVSRSTYSALFAAIGTTFGAGNGTTTFALPDLRGQFVRSWADNGTAYDSGRTFGSTQADDLASHTHAVALTTASRSPGIATAQTYSIPGGSTATTAVGGTETRPRNIALLACIKF
jgi:microcystin-dependent protein